MSNLKSFGELYREQAQREAGFLSQLMGETSSEDLVEFEADLAQQRSRALFRIAEEMEDTQDALNQAEQLVQRLREHLEQLKGLQGVLSRQGSSKR